MADITQSFSQLLLTYGPGAMLDLPEHAVVVAGLQGWRYAGDWTYLREDRLVPLLRQQLTGKLSPNFAGLRQPPVHDEERHDDRAPGVEVLLFPTAHSCEALWKSCGRRLAARSRCGRLSLSDGGRASCTHPSDGHS